MEITGIEIVDTVIGAETRRGTEMWRVMLPWRAPGVDAMVIGARRQAVAAPATNAHDAIGTLPTATTTVDLEVIFIVAVGVLEPDLDLLTVIDTTDQAVGPDMMMMTEYEIGAPAVIATVVESVPRAPSASQPHPSQRRTNEIGGPSLYNNLLLA